MKSNALLARCYKDGKENLVCSPRGNNTGGVFGETLRNIIQINPVSGSGGKQSYQQDRIYDVNGISPALCRGGGGMSPNIAVGLIRRLTPTECARLQTIPSWYKWECSDTQQYRMLGNGWTVDVIVHILSFMKEKMNINVA